MANTFRHIAEIQLTHTHTHHQLRMSVSVSSAPDSSMTQGYNEKVRMTVCVLLPTLLLSPHLSCSVKVSFK